VFPSRPTVVFVSVASYVDSAVQGAGTQLYMEPELSCTWSRSSAVQGVKFCIFSVAKLLTVAKAIRFSWSRT
jgi:hypothetical protein